MAAGPHPPNLPIISQGVGLAPPHGLVSNPSKERFLIPVLATKPTWELMLYINGFSACVALTRTIERIHCADGERSAGDLEGARGKDKPNKGLIDGVRVVATSHPNLTCDRPL